MIPRRMTAKLKKAAKQYSVVTLTGPRQSGKTTLVRTVFDKHEYVSLENPDQRMLCNDDPRGFLKQFTGKVILDEVQRTPHLFSYLQQIVDESDIPGQFILTGSQNFLLMEKVSQSLAGRCAILHLHPFSFDELCSRKGLDPESYGKTLKRREFGNEIDLFDTMYKGFYPRIHDKKLVPEDWLSNYVQTYLERDLREIINVGDIEQYRRFVMLCAGRNGGILNLNSLANDCGISHTNARRWLSVLEESFLVMLLKPYHRNYNKRIIKSPKLYFLDTGLLCYLLGIRSPRELKNHSMRGNIFETLVISEHIKKMADGGIQPGLYYWRDSVGHEVDILYEGHNRLMAGEIKSGETFNGDFAKGLDYFSKVSGDADLNTFIVYGGNVSFMYKNTAVYSWGEL